MALTHTKTTKITVTRPEGVYIARVVTTWKENEVDEVKVNEEDQRVCLCGKVFTIGGDEPAHMIGFHPTRGWECYE